MQAQLREAEAAADKASSALESAVRQACASARDNYARFHWAVARVARLKRLTQANGESVAAARIGYRVGSRSSMDVLRAIDALYAGRRDLMRAHYDAITAFLDLKASTATLSVDDIAEVNDRLGAGQK